MSVQQLVPQFEANVARAQAVAADLSRAQFNWRPEPGRWSIAQCLSHLNVVNAQDLAPVGDAVRHARETGLLGAPPFHYGPISRKFIAYMEPPVRNKSKAPKSYEPPPEGDPKTTLSEYLRISRELRRLLESSDGIDLSRAKTKLPALPALLRSFVKMPLGARFSLIAAHDRRHLWQAEQVRNHPSFPR